MMTFAQLIAVRPDEFADVAGIIRRFAETVADRADELSTALTLLRRGWSGMAATTAFDRIAAVRVTLDDAYPGLVAFDQAVSEFAASLTDARLAAVAAATTETRFGRHRRRGWHRFDRSTVRPSGSS